ncbi:hypothetical protein GCM10007067_10090 [Lysobacter bugurensis]|uniref:Uncharacterized protein n=1 Tax=Cognatilysobacter bugurensis TaxID=543356 RepID=A0A918SZJ0_9GAMM|nr:hypothetical protein GCM10007067_10090 [Lysobacter bugurensis]
MRELNINEVAVVDGGISGYEGSGAVLSVLGTGALMAGGAISAPVIAVAVGVAAGLAIAQFLAE